MPNRLFYERKTEKDLDKENECCRSTSTLGGPTVGQDREGSAD